ncbi:MAG: MBL fold metallo-hydrolase [Planctomycetota bacterium]|jgi:glyoxylase-like metal-dependent hydrolase (beta-lactamase superfamily II)
MIIERLVVGQLQGNSYIIGDEKTNQAIVIDPGDEPDRILEVAKDKHLKINKIICTHAHFDHVGAAGDIKKETGATLLMHEYDLESYSLAKDQAALWGFDVDDLPQPDGFVEEGDNIQVGDLNFRVMHTPGHSQGGICLYGEGIVITGDTIFHGSVGRTDFPGGSTEELKKSFKRLLELPEDTKVLSGHGPETTIEREKKENFFVNEFL